MIEFGVIPRMWDIHRNQLVHLIGLSWQLDPGFLDRLKLQFGNKLTIQYDVGFNERKKQPTQLVIDVDRLTFPKEPPFISCYGTLTAWRNAAEQVWKLAPLEARLRLLGQYCKQAYDYFHQLIDGLEMLGLPDPVVGRLDEQLDDLVLDFAKSSYTVSEMGSKRVELTRDELVQKHKEEDGDGEEDEPEEAGQAPMEEAT